MPFDKTLAWVRDTGIIVKMVRDSVRARVGKVALGLGSTRLNENLPLTIWK